MRISTRQFTIAAVSFFAGIGLWFAAAELLDARVFQRGPRIYRAYSEAGLTQIISRPMEINGVAVTMDVFAADEAMMFVAPRFIESIKGETQRSWFHQDSEMAIGFVQKDKQLTRFMFVQMENEQTLLYAITQDYPLQASADDALPADLPEYPGAQRQMSIKSPQSKTQAVTFSMATAAAVVDAYYQQAMEERGWKLLPVTVGTRAVDGAFQQTFRKGKSLCVISCEPDPDGGVTVTVLMKEINL